jgi:rhodanese-related sulfurtransferase
MGSIQAGAGVDYANNTISGTELAAKLADPAEAAKIFLLDIRTPEAFSTAGHIQGAMQVDFAEWASPDNLAKLPKDKKIVVVCFTGNTAAQTVSGLRMLGFDAAVLKQGMMGWAQGQGQAAAVTELDAANYPGAAMTPSMTTSSPVPPGASFTPAPTGADYDTLAEKANSVFSSMPTGGGDYSNYTISAAQLNTKLADPAQAAELFLLDIRSKDVFDAGHIEGASQLDFTAVAVPDNLKQLPKDKKIVVVCYTGNTAAQAMTVLRMLDYDAVVLKFGMMGWTGAGKAPYITEIQAAANEVVTGP